MPSWKKGRAPWCHTIIYCRRFLWHRCLPTVTTVHVASLTFPVGTLAICMGSKRVMWCDLQLWQLFRLRMLPKRTTEIQVCFISGSYRVCTENNYCGIQAGPPPPPSWRTHKTWCVTLKQIWRPAAGVGRLLQHVSSRNETKLAACREVWRDPRPMLNHL